MEDCLTHGEFSHIAIDATIRILRRARGQADYRASPETRASAPIPDADAKRRILSVLGRTSTVLASLLVKDEVGFRKVVVFIGSDNYSVLQHRCCCSFISCFLIQCPSVASFIVLQQATPSIAAALAAEFNLAQREQVRSLATDQPSAALLSGLQEVAAQTVQSFRIGMASDHV